MRSAFRGPAHQLAVRMRINNMAIITRRMLKTKKQQKNNKKNKKQKKTTTKGQRKSPGLAAPRTESVFPL